MKCVKGYEIKPMKSAAGWYVGTTDEDGFPMCRISKYYPDEITTQKAIDNKTFFRVADEITFCNGGCGCVSEEDEDDYETKSNKELLEDLIGCSRDPYMDDIWHLVIDEIARRLGVTELNY